MNSHFSLASSRHPVLPDRGALVHATSGTRHTEKTLTRLSDDMARVQRELDIQRIDPAESMAPPAVGGSMQLSFEELPIAWACSRRFVAALNNLNPRDPIAS
jgi:hypothetical protein